MSTTLFINHASGGKAPDELIRQVLSDLDDPERRELARLFHEVNAAVFDDKVPYPQHGIRWFTPAEMLPGLLTRGNPLYGLCVQRRWSERGTKNGQPWKKKTMVVSEILISPVFKYASTLELLSVLVHEMVHAYGYLRHSSDFYAAYRHWSEADRADARRIANRRRFMWIAAKMLADHYASAVPILRLYEKLGYGNLTHQA